MKVLKFTEFENLVAQGNVIPVYATYFADLLTPVSAFLKLQKITGKAFLLESVEGREKTARYSFLGCNPFCTIKYSDNRIELENACKRTFFEGDIYDYLKHLLQKYQTVQPSGLPRFTGGAVGYLGYETIQLIEDIPLNKDRKIDIPDALFMLFDTVLVFDHLTHQIYIITNVFLDREKDWALQRIYQNAIEKINSIKKILNSNLAITTKPPTTPTDISYNLTQGVINFVRAGMVQVFPL